MWRNKERRAEGKGERATEMAAEGGEGPAAEEGVGGCGEQRGGGGERKEGDGGGVAAEKGNRDRVRIGEGPEDDGAIRGASEE